VSTNCFGVLVTPQLYTTHTGVDRVIMTRIQIHPALLVLMPLLWRSRVLRELLAVVGGNV
jgi:hypothetical protein